MKRNICAAMAAFALLATQALADGAAPLPAGKPAGLAKAQDEDNTLLYVVGAGAIIAGIALLASDNGNSMGSGSGTTTGSTTTTTT
jgi:hypothetical protein